LFSWVRGALVFVYAPGRAEGAWLGAWRKHMGKHVMSVIVAVGITLGTVAVATRVPQLRRLLGL